MRVALHAARRRPRCTLASSSRRSCGPRSRASSPTASAHSALDAFETRGSRRWRYIARSAMHMIATAYTANCAGCGGITAIGRRAGYGIVAVDPRFIPLGNATLYSRLRLGGRRRYRRRHRRRIGSISDSIAARRVALRPSRHHGLSLEVAKDTRGVSRPVRCSRKPESARRNVTAKTFSSTTAPRSASRG